MAQRFNPQKNTLHIRPGDSVEIILEYPEREIKITTTDQSFSVVVEKDGTEQGVYTEQKPKSSTGAWEKVYRFSGGGK